MSAEGRESLLRHADCICPDENTRLGNCPVHSASMRFGNEGMAQAAPKPLWAVALDKMRSHDGLRRTDGPVTLTEDEAIAFVNHYLDTSYRLDVANEHMNAAAAILQRKP